MGLFWDKLFEENGLVHRQFAGLISSSDGGKCPVGYKKSGKALSEEGHELMNYLLNSNGDDRVDASPTTYAAAHLVFDGETYPLRGVSSSSSILSKFKNRDVTELLLPAGSALSSHARTEIKRLLRRALGPPSIRKDDLAEVVLGTEQGDPA